jgi:hypothetical protein
MHACDFGAVADERALRQSGGPARVEHEQTVLEVHVALGFGRGGGRERSFVGRAER